MAGWAIDSGARAFICDPNKEALETVPTSTGQGIELETMAGVIDVSQAAMVSVKPLDRAFPTLLVQGSPSAVSMEQLVENNGYEVLWSKNEGFTLRDPDGRVVPTAVTNFVPHLLPRSAQAYAALMGQLSQEELDACLMYVFHTMSDAEQQKCVSEYFSSQQAAMFGGGSNAPIVPNESSEDIESYNIDESIFDSAGFSKYEEGIDAVPQVQEEEDGPFGASIDIDEAPGQEENPLSAPKRKANKSTPRMRVRIKFRYAVPRKNDGTLPDPLHCLTHRKADPRCKICGDVRMKRFGGYKLTEFGRDERKAKTPLGRVHLGEVGPTDPDIYGNTILVCTRDDASGYPRLCPTRGQRPETQIAAFVSLYPGNRLESPPRFPKQIACDNAFRGRFQDECQKRGAEMLFSTPCDPRTNSVAERFHQEVERGTAAGLVQSGLPYGFWSHSARHWMYNWARGFDCEVIGMRSPFERYYQKEFAGELVPFGCEVAYITAAHQKFAERTRRGICIGYGQLGSLQILDYSKFAEDRTRAITTTRDIQVEPSVFPALELRVLGENPRDWKLTPDTEAPLNFTTGSDGSKTCLVCGLKIVEAPVTCEICLKHQAGEKGQHPRGKPDISCARSRCKGHKCAPTMPSEQCDTADNDAANARGRANKLRSDISEIEQRIAEVRKRAEEAGIDLDEEDLCEGGVLFCSDNGRPPFTGDVLDGMNRDAEQNQPQDVVMDDMADAVPQARAPVVPNVAPAVPAAPMVDPLPGVPFGDGMPMLGMAKDKAETESSGVHSVAYAPVHEVAPSLEERLNPEDPRFDLYKALKIAMSDRSEKPAPSMSPAELLGLLMRVIPTSSHEARTSRKCLEAINAALTKILGFGTFKLEDLKPWSWVVQNTKDLSMIHFARSQLILGMKHAEKAVQFQKAKARFVLDGNFIVDGYGRKVAFAEQHAIPASLAAIRAALIYSMMQPGGECLLGDAINAYLKALMPGPETCWMQLDSLFLPPHASAWDKPCVPLKGAIYGHPRAGGSMEQEDSRGLNFARLGSNCRLR